MSSLGTTLSDTKSRRRGGPSFIKDFIMFKKSLVGISLSILVILSACNLFVSDSKKEDVLVLGTNVFPPYEVINDDGEWEGFDIDVANIIAKKLGKKLVIKDMSFDSLIVSLKQDKIDMVIAGMSITPTRKQEVTMVHYHGKALTSFPLAFWKKIPDGVTCLQDLKTLQNKTVCVQAGQIQADFIDQFDFVDVKKMDEIADLIMDIKYGKSIACLLEPFVVNSIKKQHSEIQVLDVLLAQKDQSFGHGIGIKKENLKLKQQVKNIVAELKQDGTLKALSIKWFENKGDA